MEADVRFLVSVEELSPGYMRARLLHRIINHSMDLQQLDSVVTLTAISGAFDDLALLCGQGIPAVIDVEEGRVVRASSSAEAGIRPAQKLVFRLEEKVGSYAMIYVARRYYEPLKDYLTTLKYHWSHQVGERKHILTTKDAVQFNTDHCSECANVRLLNSAICPACVGASYSPVYRVAFELLGMVKLADSGKSINGSFSARAGTSGAVQVISGESQTATNAYDLQAILERAVKGGR